MEEKHATEESREKGKKISLILIQIAVCLVLVLAFLILRAVGGELWETVRTWYSEALRDSLIAVSSV